MGLTLIRGERLHVGLGLAAVRVRESCFPQGVRPRRSWSGARAFLLGGRREELGNAGLLRVLTGGSIGCVGRFLQNSWGVPEGGKREFRSCYEEGSERLQISQQLE